MMIFYLQQTSPPVIPVLQEMHKGAKPEVSYFLSLGGGGGGSS
jgi:hypothetical protein